MNTNKRSAIDFFNDFDGLMRIHNAHIEDGYHILPKINRPYGHMTAEDAYAIVDGLRKGDVHNRIRELRAYLEKVLDLFILRTTDKRHWEEYYGDYDGVDVYSIEVNMIPVLRRLLGDLQPPVDPSFFGVITPDEIMALTSIGRQRGLPEHVMQYSVSPYVGKKAKGGIKKRQTKSGKTITKKQTKKSKKQTKKTKKQTKKTLNKHKKLNTHKK